MSEEKTYTIIKGHKFFHYQPELIELLKAVENRVNYPGVELDGVMHPLDIAIEDAYDNLPQEIRDLTK